MEILAGLDSGQLHEIHTLGEDEPGVSVYATATKNPHGELKTISLNTGLLPGVFWDLSFIKHLRTPAERVKELIDRLKKENADVICLQEVFDQNASKKILEALGEEYYIAHSAGISTFAITSGLMTLSKFPIIESDFQGFNNLYGEDVFSNKGFLHVKLKINDDSLSVYNTHVQASGSAGGITWPICIIQDIYRMVIGLPAITSEMRRAEEFELIYQHMQKTKATLGVHLYGDLNSQLLEVSPSTEKSKLLQYLHYTAPENFDSNGDKDKAVVSQYTYPGTSLRGKVLAQELKMDKVQKTQSENRVKSELIDIIGASHGCVKVLIKEVVDPDSNKSFTDHLMLVASIKLYEECNSGANIINSYENNFCADDNITSYLQKLEVYFDV